MPAIFISYRRRDSVDANNALYQALVERFGRINIFRDAASLQIGQRWRERLDAEIALADVVLVVMGPAWQVADLHRHDDVVCWEIATALNMGKTIVPVFLPGAPRPLPQEVPSSMARFMDHQGISIRSDSSSAGGLSLADVRKLRANLFSILPATCSISITKEDSFLGAIGLDGKIYASLNIANRIELADDDLPSGVENPFDKDFIGDVGNGVSKTWHTSPGAYFIKACQYNDLGQPMLDGGLFNMYADTANFVLSNGQHAKIYCAFSLLDGGLKLRVEGV